MAASATPRAPPSARWTSFDSWAYSGMRERLQEQVVKIDKSVLLRHAEAIHSKKFTLSQPFSAGQYWVCFELISEDGSLVIARVRLPRHPDALPDVTEEDETYSVQCEVTTMRFVRDNLPGVSIPRVYAYEGPGSKLAEEAGACYMLLEGFYGNSLQDVEFDMCNLPAATQEHIITQWTRVQAEIATLSYGRIGSICSISGTGTPVIGRLASAPAEGLKLCGPFSSTAEYFAAIADAGVAKLDSANIKVSSGQDPPFDVLGAFVFRDIVLKTDHFRDVDDDVRFPLNHMDLGTQNILVDEAYDFQAIIDWEFAQTAPWQVNHYPMPFPLTESESAIQRILDDSDHLAHKAVSKQHQARRMYREKFQEAECELEEKGHALCGSYTGVLDSPASRIYACFTTLGRLTAADSGLVHEMARLGFGFDQAQTQQYLDEMTSQLRSQFG